MKAFRVAALLLVSPLAMSGSALAAQSNSLTGVRCEEQVVIDYMSETMEEMTFVDSNRERASSVLGKRKIISAKTVRAAGDTLICRIRIQFTFRGETQFQNGRFTLKLLPDDRVRASYTPNY